MSRVKDEALEALASKANVAQFVSFDSSGEQRCSAIAGHEIGHRFASAEDAVEKLFSKAPDGAINVRAFWSENLGRTSVHQGLPFHYGLTRVDEALSAVKLLWDRGLSTIVNETIDVSDGGVSGVSQSGVIEFSPDDTPRCVERPGVVSLPSDSARRLLMTVYGTPLIEVTTEKSTRVEFSIHPNFRGYRNSNVVLWESSEALGVVDVPSVEWPNNFSTMIGDKAFGLLLAHCVGLPVPRSLVISRRVAPFEFGTDTGRNEYWMRTCPAVAEPGRHPTTRGWSDPFDALCRAERDGYVLPSVIRQQAVGAVFSGAAGGEPMGRRATIEGTVGYGDEFMLGRDKLTHLPATVRSRVSRLFQSAQERLGAGRIEWVDDGAKAWLVQVHQDRLANSKDVIFPGVAAGWLEFDPRSGLDHLRSLVAVAQQSGQGVLVLGAVGVTSHVGDLLRKARVPSKRLIGSNVVQSELFVG